MEKLSEIKVKLINTLELVIITAIPVFFIYVPFV